MKTQGRGAFGPFRRMLIGVLLACAAGAGLSAAPAFGGVVPTDRGPVRGVETAGVKHYLGIPYAAPPVGELRWRPPQAPERWHGPRDASQFANHCPQVASPFGFESETEDCLYLNVFTPDKKKVKKGSGKGKNLPVMVWLHGGGLSLGESDDYDPTRLVEKGVIVVTVNYRLGLLGFLAHPALSAESGNGSGNYGFMDQQAALRWVQANIKKFGGNRDNVTIFGESAGGLSVHAHLASPLAAGLFHRAISQSGAYQDALPSLSTAESRGSTLAQNLGCSDQAAACLRSVPVETLLLNQPTTAGVLSPNVDGNVLPQSIGAALESGEFNRVPVVEGTTHDEFAIFTIMSIEDAFFGGNPIPNFFYGTVLGILIPTLGLNTTAEEVQALYPLSDFGGGPTSASQAVTAIATDAIFACPGRRAARSMSQFVPTYAYEFNDRNAPDVFLDEPVDGAYHASELAYLFDSPLRGGHAPFDPDQETLAATMVSYWTQFGRSGNPNGAGTPTWPAYTVANDTYQSLVPPTPHPETGFAEDHNCGFWDSL